MPYLKQIAAHTNCQNIQRYLEKGDRALAKDFFNLSIDERDGYGDAGKEELRWADEMDETRHRFRNDLPFGGLRARTYKHFTVHEHGTPCIAEQFLRRLGVWPIGFRASKFALDGLLCEQKPEPLARYLARWARRA